jgi:hypothetical protein
VKSGKRLKRFMTSVQSPQSATFADIHNLNGRHDRRFALVPSEKLDMIPSNIPAQLSGCTGMKLLDTIESSIRFGLLFFLRRALLLSVKVKPFNTTFHFLLRRFLLFAGQWTKIS